MSMSMMEVDQALKQLRLSGIRATLETRIIESQVSNLTFVETFSAILQDELDRRQSRLLERRFQLSGLDERACAELAKTFDFRPAAIIEQLDLLRPIYRQTTNYGHFGKPGLPWEA